MNFAHLKCQQCEKHFCCVIHRIDHENKNHIKPKIPEVKYPLKVQLYKPRTNPVKITRNTRSKVTLKTPVLDRTQNTTLLNDKFGVVTSSLIYLQNFALQSYNRMSTLIERPNESNITVISVVKKLENNSAMAHDDRCQSTYICSNTKVSTAEKINVKTSEIRFNIRKRAYGSHFCMREIVLKSSPFSPESKKRRILVPIRRRKFKSNSIVKIVEIENKWIETNSPVMSEMSTMSNKIVSPLNENYTSASLKASTPITSEFGGLIKHIISEPNMGLNKVEVGNETTQNYSPVLSEISASSSNLVSPLNENDSDNSLKASTPIMSDSGDLGDASPTSTVSFYQTPFGNYTTETVEQTLSIGKGLNNATPLRGIIVKTPKFKGTNETSMNGDSPKLRKVTFYEYSNNTNTKQLESVQELDCEEDYTEELASPERKSLFNTMAGIVSSAIHGFPSLMKTSWEWGQEVYETSNQSEGVSSKRLHISDSQLDLSLRSPVPKRLCYRGNLVWSPIRGRRALGSYNLNEP